MSDLSLSWSGKYYAAKTSALFLMNQNLFQSHALIYCQWIPNFAITCLNAFCLLTSNQLPV